MLHTVRNLIFVMLVIMVVLALFKGMESDDGRRHSSATSRSQAANPDRLETNTQQLVNQMVLRPASNGHYFVTAEIDGVDVRFIVDTGATVVALSRDDAERIGLDPANLDYSATFQTANGVVKQAPVILDEVRLGDIEIDNVRASVSQAPMGISLLGMSFLRRLDGYQVENGNLILYW